MRQKDCCELSMSAFLGSIHPMTIFIIAVNRWRVIIHRSERLEDLNGPSQALNAIWSISGIPPTQEIVPRRFLPIQHLTGALRSIREY